MSLFTVALNQVLDRMKQESALTRQGFAARIEMPNTTLASYASARTIPDAAAITKILEGVEGPDAERILAAYLGDMLPEQWRSRVSIAHHPVSVQPVSLADCVTLNPAFRRDLELLIAEAHANEHISGLLSELVTLLGLRNESSPAKVIPYPAAGDSAEPAIVAETPTQKGPAK